MAQFLFGRALQSLLLLWLVSMIGFAILHLAPGGPLSQFALVAGHDPGAAGRDRP